MIKLTSKETCRAVNVMQEFGSLGGGGENSSHRKSGSVGANSKLRFDWDGKSQSELSVCRRHNSDAQCEVIARSPQTSVVIDQ